MSIVTQSATLNGDAPPFGANDRPSLSPQAAYEARQQIGDQVGPQLRSAAAQFPSSRQRTQGEILNLTLALELLGNPFSVRRIPFSVMRDMLTDPMIGFAYYYTKIPLMRADWRINCPDPQIAAAADAALRPVNPRIQNQMCGKLGYGFQPMCKRFKLGDMRDITYRDRTQADPDKDLPVWSSNVPMLLFDDPQALPPEHCMPKWNEQGEFAGFTYSLIPLPNPVMVGTAEIYGYQDIPGYTVGPEFAVWPVNERDESFGSIFGSPRTKRAYRYWWSYWYRWALADRIFESCADPVKIVYYPTDVTEGIDPNDEGTNPTALSLQNRALEIGASARQGATLAMPGDFMRDDASGRMSTMRKWAIEYLENKADFSALDSTFTHLDALKFRAMMLPEEAFVQPGQGQRSARNVATQLGELYQESTVLLAQENDDEINKHFLPQFIEANFPERIGIPCTKESVGFGQQDADTVKQIIQLIGQVKGEVLPVDVREMLFQMGIPLMSEEQQKQAEEQIAKEAASSLPPEGPPEKVGMQGTNSGIGRTPQGDSFYYRGPERIDLSTSNQGFLAELPSVPAYKDASIRSSMMKLRKVMLERYKDQIESFATHLKERTTLHLAQQTIDQPTPDTSTPPQPDLGKGLVAAAAAGVATTIVTSWAANQGVDATKDSIAGLLFSLAQRAGLRELHAANLAADFLEPTEIRTWASRRAQFVVGSVDSTLQGELITFLTNQLQRDADPDAVAQAAEERFADTAVTHADRVVLAEALPAYNYGQLTALNSAGVSQVQAHDASDGRDQLTDAECKQRDGEVMDVGDALVEAQSEHPAGTLYFTALSTDNFRVDLQVKWPEGFVVENDMLASYDPGSERLVILDSATDEQRREFTLAVGRALTLC